MLYLFIVLVFALFIWIIIEDDKIAHIEVTFDGKYERHKVLPDSDLLDGVLTDSELDVLERVDKKFEYFGSVEISNYSHKEGGYRLTSPGEIISYNFALTMNLD